MTRPPTLADRFLARAERAEAERDVLQMERDDARAAIASSCADLAATREELTRTILERDKARERERLARLIATQTQRERDDARAQLARLRGPLLPVDRARDLACRILGPALCRGEKGEACDVCARSREVAALALHRARILGATWALEDCSDAARAADSLAAAIQSIDSLDAARIVARGEEREP